jgi:hypothetical protein
MEVLLGFSRLIDYLIYWSKAKMATVPGTNRYLGTQYRPTNNNNNNNNIGPSN